MPRKRDLTKRTGDRKPAAGSGIVWYLIAAGVAGLFAMSLFGTTPEVEIAYSDLERLIRGHGDADASPVGVEIRLRGDDRATPRRFTDLRDVVIGAYAVTGSIRPGITFSCCSWWSARLPWTTTLVSP